MKIKRVEPIAVSIPMRKPVFMAGVEIRTADNVLVRIEADNGTIGWGEAASAPTMTGETVESMMAAVAYLAPAVEGRPAEDIAGTIAAMRERMYANTSAKAAIEMALHDLVGRATGEPAYALLGGRARRRMPILGVIGTGELASDLREAESKKAQGYVAFKIKVGIDKPLVDAERTRRVCALIGSGALMSADANQGWSTEEAVQYVRALVGTRLDFFEQPVPAEDLAGMAAVAKAAAEAGAVAIGADESIHSLEDLRRSHAQGAARGASLKTIKLGGMRAVMEAGRLCEELGLKVNVAAKTGDAVGGLLNATLGSPMLPGSALTSTRTGCAATAGMCRCATWHENETKSGECRDCRAGSLGEGARPCGLRIGQACDYGCLQPLAGEARDVCAGVRGRERA